MNTNFNDSFALSKGIFNKPQQLKMLNCYEYKSQQKKDIQKKSERLLKS